MYSLAKLVVPSVNHGTLRISKMTSIINPRWFAISFDEMGQAHGQRKCTIHFRLSQCDACIFLANFEAEHSEFHVCFQAGCQGVLRARGKKRSGFKSIFRILGVLFKQFGVYGRADYQFYFLLGISRTCMIYGTSCPRKYYFFGCQHCHKDSLFAWLHFFVSFPSFFFEPKWVPKGFILAPIFAVLRGPWFSEETAEMP